MLKLKLKKIVVDEINDRVYKKKRTYSLDPDTLQAFQKFCDSKSLKYSQVVEKLMLELLKQ